MACLLLLLLLSVNVADPGSPCAAPSPSAHVEYMKLMSAPMIDDHQADSKLGS